MRFLKARHIFLLIAAVVAACPGGLGWGQEAACAQRSRQVAQAEGIVRALDSRFDSIFPTTGFADYAALKAALDANAEELGASLCGAVRTDSLRVGMAARESHRDSIAANGFLNIYTSPGSSFNTGTASRNRVEAYCLNAPLSWYRELAPQVKPKYGYLLPPDDAELHAIDLSRFYGTDLYVLRMENIHSRLTWAPGDSLDRTEKWLASAQGPSSAPVSWDLFFIPWDRRELLLPLLYRDVKHLRRLGFSSTPQYPFYNMPLGPLNLKTAYFGPNAGYVEMQVWGPLDLGDVEDFIFKLTPPKGEFLRVLKDHRIRIYDGRGGKPRPWLSLVIFGRVATA